MEKAGGISEHGSLCISARTNYKINIVVVICFDFDLVLYVYDVRTFFSVSDCIGALSISLLRIENTKEYEKEREREKDSTKHLRCT